MLFKRRAYQERSDECTGVLPAEAGAPDLASAQEAHRFTEIAMLRGGATSVPEPESQPVAPAPLAQDSQPCCSHRLPGRACGAAGQALNPDRRAFLKDIALLGLCGFTIYDRWKPTDQCVIQAAPSLGNPPAAALPDDVLGDVPLSAPSLMIPIPGFRMRTLPSSRLPNALREYRQGVHEGFDLYAPYGTTVYAIGDGVVTKADEDFKLAPELHGLYLEESGQLQTTPPDILDHLRGRVVEIDHGMRRGVRWRSVYGHLSRVLVNPGQRVSQGERIAQVGNTGTTAGVKGSRDDAHLHLEIRYERAGQREHYIGEGLPERQIRRLLEEMFHA